MKQAHLDIIKKIQYKIVQSYIIKGLFEDFSDRLEVLINDSKDKILGQVIRANYRYSRASYEKLFEVFDRVYKDFEVILNTLGIEGFTDYQTYYTKRYSKIRLPQKDGLDSFDSLEKASHAYKELLEGVHLYLNDIFSLSELRGIIELEFKIELDDNSVINRSDYNRLLITFLEAEILTKYLARKTDLHEHNPHVMNEIAENQCLNWRYEVAYNLVNKISVDERLRKHFNSEKINYLMVNLRSNTSLRMLDLSGCSITLNTAKFLRDALIENCSMDYLVLNFCKIDDEGTKAISTGLERNTSLKTVIFVGNNNSTKTAKNFAKVIQLNSSLNTLLLSFCKLATGSFTLILTPLAVALNSNYSIKELRVYGVEGSASEMFTKMLERNRGIEIAY